MVVEAGGTDSMREDKFLPVGYQNRRILSRGGSGRGEGSFAKGLDSSSQSCNKASTSPGGTLLAPGQLSQPISVGGGDGI